MDDGYMTERRAETSAEDAYDGVMKGVEHLGSGIMKGMTGIVMNPYKESKKDGAKGFMRGMGKGLIGAVVKPTTGVLDLATDISTGIKKEVRAPCLVACHVCHIWLPVKPSGLLSCMARLCLSAWVYLRASLCLIAPPGAFLRTGLW